MGIPSFYRWLIDRYPLSVIEAIEESPLITNEFIYPLDTSSPNPNEIEFDNLYLDMNGIIHPCFHPQDSCQPKSFDEVFEAVFKYIDRLFSIIRPRKILFMAIDGVAPRAKMNQQRARRFRAAKDSADEESARQKLPNVSIAHVNQENDKLDSNIITPGTEFMELLSSALQYYIHLRMNNDPGWKDVKVILSDASVPGEGEHKIVSFIRLQRDLPGFDPNTRHCLYGLDADLIMLALATHEVHFTVLREDVSKSQTLDQPKRLRSGNRKKPNQGEIFSNEFDKCLSGQVFQLVRIWVLRDYLAHELQIPDPNTSTDFERLIDDFVFMCIFVGNDFLPHIPSLEIGEGGIDLLMMIYKKEFVRMGGYLTSSSKVNLKRVEHFIKAIGTYETRIFRKRNLISEARGRKEKYSQHSSAKGNRCKTQKNKDIKEDNFTIDQVKFGKDGWRERYYALKFEVQSDDKAELIKQDAVNKYVEGICWVMHYYYQGICSWSWFYPYHYAPFASDFLDIGQLEIRFDLGRPLKPFDQLMGVLPAASAQALPFFYRQMMTDPSSPILDFYPKDFEVDLNGKRHSWQGVCKLPFINEFRLLTEIAKVEHTLTDAEVRRNSLGQDVLFIYQDHPLAKIILSFWEEIKSNPKLPDSAVRKEINPVLSGGMNGYMYITEKSVCPTEVDSPIGGMEIINNNNVISVFYEAPLSHSHISKLPDGLLFPGKLISKDDVHPTAILWHERTEVMGRRCSQRPKPSNCISGPSLEMMAHRLVSQNCGGKTHEVVSDMWQRWLHRKEDGTNVEVVLTGTRNSEDVMRRVEEMWERHSTCRKRKRDGRDVSAKNPKKCQIVGSKIKKVQSRGGDGKKNDILFPCGSQVEVDCGVKLTASQKKNQRKKRNKINLDKENKDIQVCCGKQLVVAEGEEILNHCEGEKGEIDCGVKLTASQKKNRRNKRKKINVDKDIQVSCGKQLEVAEGEEILNHCEGEKREQDGGVKLEVAEGEEILVHGYGEKGEIDCGLKLTASQKDHEDIQLPCGKQLEVAEGEEILNHCEGEKGEIDCGVKLTASQKKNRRNKRKKINNVDKDIQVSCGKQLEVSEGEEILNHCEGEKREQDGGVKLEVAKGEKILVHGYGEKGEIDCGLKLAASQKEEHEDIQVPCGKQLEVAEAEEILNHGEGEKERDGGVKLVACTKSSYKRKMRTMNNKMREANGEVVLSESQSRCQRRKRSKMKRRNEQGTDL